MPLTVSNNSAVAAASHYLGKNQKALQMSIKKLASGKRLLAPNADPGTLSVSMKLNLEAHLPSKMFVSLTGELRAVTVFEETALTSLLFVTGAGVGTGALIALPAERLARWRQQPHVGGEASERILRE